jgi:hypothetical protein
MLNAIMLNVLAPIKGGIAEVVKVYQGQRLRLAHLSGVTKKKKVL